MGRKQAPERSCLVCGTTAIGLNFGVPSCMPCKAFFRRNAFRYDELKCQFSNNCKMNLFTRRFCPKCRLQKCFDCGMKKEMILSENEREYIKEKIKLNKLKRQQELETQLRELQKSKDSLVEFDQSIGGSLSSNDNRLLENILDTLNSSRQQQNDTDSTTEDIAHDNQSEFELNSTLGDYCDQLLLNNVDNLSQFDPLETERLGTSLSDIINDTILYPTPESDSTITDSCESRNFGISSNLPDEIKALELFNDSHDNLQYMLLDMDRYSYQRIQWSAGSSQSTDENNSALIKSDHSYIEKSNDSQTSDIILDFVPHNVTIPNGSPSMCLELSVFPLSQRQLIQPELSTLFELNQACAILKNPYRAIQDALQLDLAHSSKVCQYFYYRAIQMAKSLPSFASLTRTDQKEMLKYSLIKMLSLRTAVWYNSHRDAWGLVDDKYKCTTMIKLELLRPHCANPVDYKRHQELPRRYRDEWKQDNLIFDLLTVIVLFTPRDHYSEKEKIKQEHLRYIRLLRRYLEIKYPNSNEAKECFRTLLGNVVEMFQLNNDIISFMTSFREAYRGFEFFTEMFDLDQEGLPTNSVRSSPLDPANGVPENFHSISFWC